MLFEFDLAAISLSGKHNNDSVGRLALHLVAAKIISPDRSTTARDGSFVVKIDDAMVRQQIGFDHHAVLRLLVKRPSSQHAGLFEHQIPMQRPVGIERRVVAKNDEAGHGTMVIAKDRA